MARYFIESVKCGVGEGGSACGPMDGPVVAEVKVKSDENEEFYMSLAEVDGIPNFAKTAESTYDNQVNMDFDDEAIEAFQKCQIDGIEDYYGIFDDKDSEWYQLYRYLIYIVRADWKECEKFQKKTKGKWLDEIEIPASDIEEEYLEDYEDDEE